MLLNIFLFYQVVRPLGRKSVNKYLYLVRSRPSSLNLTLKTFTVNPSHTMNTCGKYHWNPSTKYRDTAADVQTDGQMDDLKT